MAVASSTLGSAVLLFEVTARTVMNRSSSPFISAAALAETLPVLARLDLTSSINLPAAALVSS